MSVQVHGTRLITKYWQELEIPNSVHTHKRNDEETDTRKLIDIHINAPYFYKSSGIWKI